MLEGSIRPSSVIPGQAVVIQSKRSCYKPAMRRGVVFQVLSRPDARDKDVRVILEDGTQGIVCTTIEDPTIVAPKT